MIKICVIGGSGFIGTRLCERLSEHKPFVILDKKRSPLFSESTLICDVRNINMLQASLLDNSLIVNLAAEHRDDVRPLKLYDDVNVDGARNICTVAREKNIQTIIFTSSVAVYGFAPRETGESGKIAPFNDYGRTKYEAEQIYKAWQAEASTERTLVIIRPTVVFGEQNRGNVYNLLRQIASGKFVMVGSGENKKSIAYVENLAAFIEYTMSFKPGVHVYNYIDKPDFTMNQLVVLVNQILGKSKNMGLHLPFFFGYWIGKIFDFVAFLTGKRFPISSIRVKKFCSDSVYSSAIDQTNFVPPVSLGDAVEQTIRYEFIEMHHDEPVYFSE